jgi:chitin disaccharide deacetylase
MKPDLTTATAKSGHIEGFSPDLPIPRAGLIVNADDWGRDETTTRRIMECAAQGSVSAVSAMVFMQDSERAAALALEAGIDAGLHLNLTTPFSGAACSSQLRERQDRVARFLTSHRLSQIVFNPWLARSFEYLVAAQLDEYHRIYGDEVRRLDGHHHMHLSANVLLQRLLPQGTIVRRSFYFEPQEKSLLNRLYRQSVDRTLARRHRLADFFFSIQPVTPDRLQRIYTLARRHVVEMETHPVVPEEHQYLTGGGIFREARDVRIARPSAAFGPSPMHKEQV